MPLDDSSSASKQRQWVVMDVTNPDVIHSEAATAINQGFLVKKITKLSASETGRLAEILGVHPEPSALVQGLITVISKRGSSGIGSIKDEVTTRLNDLWSFLDELEFEAGYQEDEVIGN